MQVASVVVEVVRRAGVHQRHEHLGLSVEVIGVRDLRPCAMHELGIFLVDARSARLSILGIREQAEGRAAGGAGLVPASKPPAPVDEARFKLFVF